MTWSMLSPTSHGAHGWSSELREACESAYHNTTGVVLKPLLQLYIRNARRRVQPCDKIYLLLAIGSLNLAVCNPKRSAARCRNPTSTLASTTIPNPLIASTHMYRQHHIRTR